MMKNDKLQSIIDSYVQSESGAQLSRSLKSDWGAVADMLYDPESNSIAFQMIVPPESMPYERISAFQLQDFLHQKNKEQDRLALRSVDGTIYVLEPIKSDAARHDFAFYQPNNELKQQIRDGLNNFFSH